MVKPFQCFPIFIFCVFLAIGHKQAFSDYREALEIDPMLAEIYSDLGTTSLKKGEYERAIFYFDKALEVDSRFAQVYNNRGVAYGNLGLFKQALSDYRKALEIDPILAETYSNRGTLYLEKGKYELAISDFNKALEICSVLAQIYNNRGIAHMKKGEYESAISDFDHAFKNMNPMSAQVYFNKARLYERFGHTQEAKKSYQTFVKHAPPSYNLYINQANERIRELTYLKPKRSSGKQTHSGWWLNIASWNRFGGRSKGTKLDLLSMRIRYVNLGLASAFNNGNVLENVFSDEDVLENAFDNDLLFNFPFGVYIPLQMREYSSFGVYSNVYLFPDNLMNYDQLPRITEVGLRLDTLFASLSAGYRFQFGEWKNDGKELGRFDGTFFQGSLGLMTVPWRNWSDSGWHWNIFSLSSFGGRNGGTKLDLLSMRIRYVNLGLASAFNNGNVLENVFSDEDVLENAFDNDLLFNFPFGVYIPLLQVRNYASFWS